MMKSEMITETPQKALLHFSLPLLAGSIFQNLYNVFDSMIVGQMLGKEALSAVGNSYVPMLIVNSVLLGVSSGISILVSQCYGAQKQVDAQECIRRLRNQTCFGNFRHFLKGFYTVFN